MRHFLFFNKLYLIQFFFNYIQLISTICILLIDISRHFYSFYLYIYIDIISTCLCRKHIDININTYINIYIYIIQISRYNYMLIQFEISNISRNELGISKKNNNNNKKNKNNKKKATRFNPFDNLFILKKYNKRKFSTNQTAEVFLVCINAFIYFFSFFSYFTFRRK